MLEYEFRIDIIRNGINVKGFEFRSSLASAMDIFWLSCNAFQGRVDLYLGGKIFVARDNRGTEHYYSRSENRSISFKIAK